MIKVLAVFGTRPEAIKMAPLVKELEAREGVESIVCVTAQHRDMLDQVLEVFDITPDYDLNLMKPNQTLGMITSKVLTGLEEVIESAKPDIILVHGDTTTAFSSAIAAFYKQIPIGHVEAGLRTWDKTSPYPEEFNRQAISIVSDMNFAPTSASRDNLIKEGRVKEDIFVTGNTAIDAMKFTVKEGYSHDVFKWVGNDKMILLTAHRRENLGDPMRGIFKAIRRVVDEFKDYKVVYPVHLNPKVRSIANEVFSGCDNVRLIEPLEVVDFHNFMKKSEFILTDSGGVQEEAPSLGKPVLVLRNTTERPEGVDAGTLKLVGVKEDDVYANIKQLITDKEVYGKMSKASNPYGDGEASRRIVDEIINRLTNDENR